jgi:hypothetical protein
MISSWSTSDVEPTVRYRIGMAKRWIALVLGSAGACMLELPSDAGESSSTFYVEVSATDDVSLDELTLLFDDLDKNETLRRLVAGTLDDARRVADPCADSAACRSSRSE